MTLSKARVLLVTEYFDTCVTPDRVGKMQPILWDSTMHALVAFSKAEWQPILWLSLQSTRSTNSLPMCYRIGTSTGVDNMYLLSRDLEASKGIVKNMEWK